MDDLEDEIPEIIELIQKEGLIEKDKEGALEHNTSGRAQDPGQGARRPVPDVQARFTGPP